MGFLLCLYHKRGKPLVLAMMGGAQGPRHGFGTVLYLNTQPLQRSEHSPDDTIVRHPLRGKGLRSVGVRGQIILNAYHGGATAPALVGNDSGSRTGLVIATAVQSQRGLRLSIIAALYISSGFKEGATRDCFIRPAIWVCI